MHLPRSSGILLHPTSLPGPFGIGALGREALRFVDFLADARQSVWQILPLGPTGYGDSPYSSYSAFAGNPLLIDLEQLVECGDLLGSELNGQALPTAAVDFQAVHQLKDHLLQQAAQRFHHQATAERRAAYDEFCAYQAYWLNDYALFMSARREFKGTAWNRWPTDLCRREEEALRIWGERLAGAIDTEKYVQFTFFQQWQAVKSYANSKGISIFGDIPIFVAFDSADVWANPHLFHLDENLRPTLVAGVPPDYFSKTGQRWGNPLYRWERLQEDGYSWWLARLKWNLAITDLVRIDHFRGFAASWAIPAAEKTAINGSWMPVPGEDFFNVLSQRLGRAPIIAEDLGVITPDVEALRDRFEFPGMKILHFAFDSGPTNPYLPHNYQRNCVVYTGTHDNDTTRGWWNNMNKKNRDEVRTYLGHPCRDIVWDLIRVAQASVANLCIIPLQDVLDLDQSSRMNRPGQAQGNWAWRVQAEQLDSQWAERLSALSTLYGRAHRRNNEES